MCVKSHKFLRNCCLKYFYQRLTITVSRPHTLSLSLSLSLSIIYTSCSTRCQPPFWRFTMNLCVIFSPPPMEALLSPMTSRLTRTVRVMSTSQTSHQCRLLQRNRWIYIIYRVFVGQESFLTYPTTPSSQAIGT